MTFDQLLGGTEGPKDGLPVLKDLQRRGAGCVGGWGGGPAETVSSGVGRQEDERRGGSSWAA